MKENREEIMWNVNSDLSPETNLPEEQRENSLHTFHKTQHPLREPSCKGDESSKILKIYLRSLESCAKKKRHRCISQELGR